MPDLSEGFPSSLQLNIPHAHPQRQETLSVQDLRKRILQEFRSEEAHAEAARHPQQQLEIPSQSEQPKHQHHTVFLVERYEPNELFEPAFSTEPLSRQFESPPPLHLPPPTTPKNHQ